MNWELENKKVILETVPFSVEELQFKEGNGFGHSWTRLKCPDWVNILPVTPCGKALLIRQMRVGSLSYCLETPGGCLERDEVNDPTLAAARELEEETGYRSRSLLGLGSVNPNPAINSNKIHFFLARDCVQAEDRKNFPDQSEEIELVPTDCRDLDRMVRTGEIGHGLAAHCILLAGKYLDIGAT